MAILIITVLTVCILSEATPVSAGYWQLQNDPIITFGPDNNTREWTSQGLKIQIAGFDTRHVLVTESGMVGGGFNTLSWRSEWSPPDKIIPGEVVNASVKATCTALSYERSQFPFNFEVPLAQWIGLGGAIVMINNEDHKGTAPGASVTRTNSSFKAPVPAPGTSGEAMLKFGIPLRYSNGFNIQFRYAWVKDNATAPQTAIPSSFYNLSGGWYAHVPQGSGGSSSIEQNGQDLLLINEFGGKSRATYKDPTTIVCIDWANSNGSKLVGKLVPEQGRINWDNGTWWVKN
jgi:hypothetical protein